MSSFAAAVILHPKLNQSLAVLATTIGRDKAYRLIQYLARLLSWSYKRRGLIETADRFDGLNKGLGTGRKVLRLFRPAEFIQTAIKLAQRPVNNLNGPGQVAHLAQIGRQVGYAGFFGYDMLVWLGSIRFLKHDKDQIARFQRLSFKFWLAGISLSLASTIASLSKLRADGRRFALSNQIAKKESQSEKTPEDRTRAEVERREKGRALLLQRQTLLSALVSDACDIWIPATNLGYANVNDGVLGFLGAFTSYMALQTQWAKHSAVGVRKTA